MATSRTFKARSRRHTYRIEATLSLGDPYTVHFDAWLNGRHYCEWTMQIGAAEAGGHFVMGTCPDEIGDTLFPIIVQDEVNKLMADSAMERILES